MIVPVTNENERIWAELCAELWQGHTAGEMLRERSDGKLRNEFLYMSGGEAVAFISLSLRSDYVEGAESSPVGFIEGIYVKPAYRGKGVARELAAFAKAWSKEHGCSELASDCELVNETSRQFHEAIGFRETNRVICFIMALE